MAMDAGRFSQMTHLNNMRDVKNSGVKAAQTNVLAGNTGVTKQQTESKVKEESTLSEAAKKLVQDQKDVQDASAKGGAKNAEQAAGKKQASKREKTKDKGDLRGADNKYFANIPDSARTGDILPTEDGGSVVVGDIDAGIENTKLDKAQTQRFQYLDSEANVKAQYEGTPNTEVTKKMAEPKIGNKEGRKKNADLKAGDAKFGDQVESLVLEPTAKVDPRGKVGPAGIKTPKDEKPLMFEDPHSEGLAKEAAAKQLAAGGGHEAFVA